MKNPILLLLLTLVLNACQSEQPFSVAAAMPSPAPSQTTWKIRFPSLWESAYAGTQEPDPATVTYSQFVAAVAAKLKSDSGSKYTEWVDLYQLNCNFSDWTDWSCPGSHATRAQLPFDPATMASCEYRLDPGLAGFVQANVVEGSSTSPSRLMFYSPYLQSNGDLTYHLYQFEFWSGLAFQSLRAHAYYERKESVVPGTHGLNAVEFSSWGTFLPPGTLNGKLQIRCQSK